ncbi:AraC-like DNA-binding protein [Paenibacillus rhizosphaerae]|uniref:AraC-like DNA-binding protein n=1 Tax=Paenibacillus rhizosphaerae TaxID=297318 RepID=A0A839TZK8_9BACL|nr:AraC family transcriptional regulator [Paenibacillus rhizosphaerae]MBB3130970.1 AraC-like DNA-binding protein [Paenibacillus rhizosphaerae]
MRNSWYHRMLLSYFPIFLITVTVLVFLSFLVVNEISQKETVKADRISTRYIVDTVQMVLKEIEMNALDEVERNSRYNDFLQANGPRERDAVYAVVDSLRTLAAKDELVDSVYVYRSGDRQTLTTSGLLAWDEFADRPFVEQALSQPAYQGWSPIRDYHEMGSDAKRRVISMYKRAPLPFGTQGFVVINVNMYALEQKIRTMKATDVSFLQIRDRDGNLIFSTRPSEPEGIEAVEGRILNRISFQATGWTFESGIAAGQLFMWVSVVSYIWIVIGVGTVLAAVVYLLYITKRNYKPIRAMMNRIEAVRDRMDPPGGAKSDELLLIDRALENLIRQTADYEKQQQENMLIARRQLFIDLVQGERLGDANERLERLKPLPVQVTWPYQLVLVEILEFSRFQQGFSVQDQSTLKFALTNVLQEMARDEGLHSWGEWTEANRMGLLLGRDQDETEEETQERIRRLSERGIAWTYDHLGLSLMVSVGPRSDSWEEVSASYQGAARALQHKLSLGQRAFILSEDMPANAATRTYTHLQGIAEFVKQFRLSDDDWRSRLERIFDDLKADALKDEDIRMMLLAMMEMLAREVGDLSEQLQSFFTGERAGSWRRAVEETTSLEQLRTLFTEQLAEIYRTFVAVSETKSHRAMIVEMKAYIEENFADPDLSLKHLSDRFQISGKYASYLFKEEFNMKFVDFMVQLRMAKAERLLLETDDTVQHIALQVGYANSITFGRTFKREVGVTPGDYRKLKAKTQRDVPI